MRRILVLAALLALGGCGVWSTTMRTDLVDYNDVIGQTANKFLLINILEARDSAPLHFSAIPHINGSLQASASLGSSVPFQQSIERDLPGGAAAGSAFLNGSVSPGLSVSSSPSFEVDSVETREFITGIASPIDPKFIKYWVDRGIDKRIVFLLFFSAVEIVDTKYNPCADDDVRAALQSADALSHRSAQCSDKDRAFDAELFSRGAAIVIHNNPRDAADKIRHCLALRPAPQCRAITEFEQYLYLLDTSKEGATANAYSERTLIDHDIAIAPKDIVATDPHRYQIERLPDGKFDVFSMPAGLSYAFCVDGRYEALSGAFVRPEDTHSIMAPAIRDGDTPVAQSALPPHGDVCSDPVINVYPFLPQPQLPGARAFLPSEKTSADEPYFAAPCDQTAATGGRRPYCELFKRFSDADNADSRYRLVLTPRSVTEMIRYLGDLVYYQEQMPQTEHHNSPLTLGYDENCQRMAGGHADETPCLARDGGWLFNLKHDADGGQLSVHYRGRTYALDEHSPGDHSLEVLSILNQLVNLSKSADDLRSTQIVHVIP